LYVGGNSTISGNVNILKTTESASVTTGALIVSGGAGIAANLYVGGNSTISGNVNISKNTESTSTSSGTLIVTGGVGISANLYVGGNTNISKTTESISTSTGALIVSGGAGIASNLYVGGNSTISGNVNISKTTESSSTSTGALIVSGGAGIGKKLYVGGDLYLNNNYSLKLSNNNSSTDDLSFAKIYKNSSNFLNFYNNQSMFFYTPSGMGMFFKINDSQICLVRDSGLDLSGNLNVNGKIIFGSTASKLYDDGELRIETDNYMYFKCRDSYNLVLKDEGSGVKTCDIYGNVGINKASTTYTFDVSGSCNVSGDTTLRGKTYIGLDNPGGGGGDSAYLEYLAISGENTTLRINTTNDPYDHINLNPTGNVGINNDSPAYKLHVNGSCSVNSLTTNAVYCSGGSCSVNSLTTNAVYCSGGILSDSDGNAIYFNQNKSYNKWLITTYNTSIAHTNFEIRGNTGNAWTSPIFYLNQSGNSYCLGQSNAVSFNASSNYSLKTNITNLNEQYNIDKLRPVQYNLKNDISNNDYKLNTGFIAHEVQEHFPHLVTGEKDGKDMQSLNYDGLISILTYNIQQLKSQITQQQSQITQQQSQITQQQSQITQQQSQITQQQSQIDYLMNFITTKFNSTTDNTINT
jgi:hypothetical protein